MSKFIVHKNILKVSPLTGSPHLIKGNNMTKLLSLMLKGSIMNIKIFGLTLLFALPLGFIVAKGRMSKIKIVKALVNIYIQIMRGTPL